MLQFFLNFQIISYLSKSDWAPNLDQKSPGPAPARITGPYAKIEKEGKVKDSEESLCFRLGRKGKDSEERKVRTAR